MATSVRDFVQLAVAPPPDQRLQSSGLEPPLGQREQAQPRRTSGPRPWGSLDPSHLAWLYFFSIIAACYVVATMAPHAQLEDVYGLPGFFGSWTTSLQLRAGLTKRPAPPESATPDLPSPTLEPAPGPPSLPDDKLHPPVLGNDLTTPPTTPPPSFTQAEPSVSTTPPPRPPPAPLAPPLPSGSRPEVLGDDKDCDSSWAARGAEQMKKVIRHEVPMDVIGENHITGASAGKYDGCHKKGAGIYWVYLFGQVRSWFKHKTNFKTFLDRSHPCWFVVFYTRSEVASKGYSKPWSPNVDKQIDELAKAGRTVPMLIEEVSQFARNGYNLAWLALNISKRTSEQHRAVSVLGQEVARAHCIPRDDNDVIAVFRPDLVFNNAIDVSRIMAAMKVTPHLLMAHHDKAVGGNDPSEMYIVGPRKYWDTICGYKSLPGEPGHEPVSANLTVLPGREGQIPGPVASRDIRRCMVPPKVCGYFAPFFIFSAWARGFETYFIEQPLVINLARLNGQWDTSVMRGMGKRLATADSPVRDVLDITHNARCIHGSTNSCDVHWPVPETTRCHEPLKQVRIAPGGALWVCKHTRNVDGNCQ